MLHQGLFERSDDVHQDQRDRRESGLLSANFETRKRRRETYVRPDEEVSSAQASDILPDLAFLKTPERLSGKPIRAARKRRLSAQQALGVKEDDLQDFGYTKKEALAIEIAIEKKPATDASETEIGQTDAIAHQLPQSVLDNNPSMPLVTANNPGLSPKRSVLGSKTTNMSPVKSVQRSNNKKEQDSAKSTRKVAATAHHPAQQSIEIPARVAMPQKPDVVDIDVENIKLEPKTPALADLLSPTSTHPSEGPAGSRDTPPPGQLSRSHSTTDGMNAAGRGSRRARAQVNYAEPSLISKMRRPTKELVDAVGGDVKDNKRRSSSVEVVKEENLPLRVVTIKKEPGVSGEWKPTTSSMMQELSRPEPASPIQPKREVRHSSDAAVIATQTASRPETATSTSKQNDDQDLQQKMETMAIFDVQTSSPIKQTDNDVGARQQKNDRIDAGKQPAGQTVKTLGCRRQSVLPSTSARSRPTMSAKEGVATDDFRQVGQSKTAMNTAGKADTTDRGLGARGRRRSMLL